jgi:DNA repair protein RecO (recombination protein O)
MTRVTDQPGIVVHTRPYRESSLLLSILTLDHGLVTLVGRGVRGGRRGRALQPFTELRLGWSGRSSLGTLAGFEVVEQHWFQGNTLASAFYLTELITRLLDERESHPRLFAGVRWALDEMERGPPFVLRSFEKLLLEELGYGLDFERDVDGNPLQAGRDYRLVPDQGFSVLREGLPDDRATGNGVDGALLIEMGKGEFSDIHVRRAAKRVFGESLAGHLGPRPLLSRQLLVGQG